MTADAPSYGGPVAQDVTSSSPEPATSVLVELGLDPPIPGRNPSPSHLPKTELDLPTSEHKTIYYLAYGSNLCSSTFQGRRGVRPLSAIPVNVPSLNLCFNLSGIAYLEPCMANVCLRDEAALNEPTSNIAVSSTTAPSETVPLLQASASAASYNPADGPAWDKGLIGVVYEVTPEDYAKIWATEGGGSSYKDVVVPCYPLPPNSLCATAAPNTTPIKAHTLFASDPRILRSTDPQPSLRYLNLIRTGAREHELPKPYREYLDALQHYQVTEMRQKIGRWIWGMMWVPLVMGSFTLGRLLQEKDGSQPLWLRKCQETIFRVMCMCYDNGFKMVFGDGERTVVRPGRRREKEMRTEGTV